MSRNRPVTLQDVAEHAGVSRGAASFALTGRSGVSDATRERVKHSARLLGYRPNLTARNLRKAQTGLIAVYLPSIAPTLSYYTEVTFGIVEEALKSGHLVTLVPRAQDAPSLAPASVDGAIVIDPTPNDLVLSKLISSDIPVVSGEKIPPGYGRVQGEVVSNHETLTIEMLDHFAEQGASSPAIIAPGGESEWSVAIISAYRDWCQAHNIRPRIEIVDLNKLPQATISATQNLLSTNPPADAILALTEGSVLNVITSAMEYQLAVGNDLLVAAAVDSPSLQYTDPSVTAINLNPRHFGTACMRMMRSLIEGKSGRSEVLRETVPASIIVRDSTNSGKPGHPPKLRAA